MDVEGNEVEQQTVTGAEQSGTTPEKPAEGTGTPTEQTAGTEGEKQEKREDTTPPGLKRELAELRRRARDAEARAEREASERTQLMQRLLGGNAQSQQTDGAPDPSKYPGGEFSPEYTRELARYEARQVIKEEDEARTKRQRDEDAKRQSQARVESWNKSLAAAQTKYADFDVVVEAVAPELPQQARVLLANLKDGAELLYYLAKNPARVADLSGNPVEITATLGELRAELKAKATVKKEELPPPINSGAANGRSSGEPDPKNTEAWIAWDRKQSRRGRG